MNLRTVHTDALDLQHDVQTLIRRKQVTIFHTCTPHKALMTDTQTKHTHAHAHAHARTHAHARAHALWDGGIDEFGYRVWEFFGSIY